MGIPFALLLNWIHIVGGMYDYELIRTFVPPFLFPNNERTVVDWAVCGVSMGGHITWRLLRHHKAAVGVNIITVPSEGLAGWLTSGLLNKKPPDPEVIQTVPDPVRTFFTSTAPPGTYADKKILSLHAEKDTLLPASFGDAYFPGIQAQAPPGHIVQWIEPGAKHACTPEMTRRAAEWFWRWNLSSEPVAKL